MAADEHLCLVAFESLYEEMVCRTILYAEIKEFQCSMTENIRSVESVTDRTELPVFDSLQEFSRNSQSDICQATLRFKNLDFIQTTAINTETGLENTEEKESVISENGISLTVKFPREMNIHDLHCKKDLCGTNQTCSLFTLSSQAVRDGNLMLSVDKEFKTPVSQMTDSPHSDFFPEECISENLLIAKDDPVLPTKSRVDGLEHLSKLLSVVEHLEELKRANQMLQQKCAFLEDTKMLLKESNSLMQSDQPESSRKKPRSRSVQMVLRKGSGAFPGHRRSSAVARRQSLGKMHHQQRSQSVSSICELVDLDLSHIMGDTRSSGKSTDREAATSRPFDERRSVKLQKRWKQVKKVFSGRIEAGGKTETGAVSAEMLLKSNSRNTVVRRTRNVQSGNKNSLLFNRQEVLLDDVFSPVRTPGVLLGEGYPDELNLTCSSQQLPSVNSDSLSKSSCSEIPADGLSPGTTEITDESTFTPWVQQTSSKRRQSSPLISVTRPPDGNRTAFLTVDSTSVHLIGRSNSFKVSKAASLVGDEAIASKSLPSTPIEPGEVPTDASRTDRSLLQSDLGKKTKGPWSKVKDILQTRRDSLKTKSGKTECDLGVNEDFKDGNMPGTAVEMSFTSTLASSGFCKRNSRQLSVTPILPVRFVLGKNTDSSSSRPSFPPSTGGKRYSLSSAVMPSGSRLDLAALFGKPFQIKFLQQHRVETML